VGNYLLSNFGSGTYTVTPSREQQPCGASNGIFSNDAALVSQHVVGLISLSPESLTAAKVSGLMNLTSFDAALIAQSVVCVSGPMNLSGTWAFSPQSTNYPAGVIGQTLTQDYLATLMGDVNGDWNNEVPVRPAASFEDAIKVSVPKIAVQPGSLIVVPLTINDLKGIGVTSYQFDIRYDPAVITPVHAGTVGTIGGSLTPIANIREPGLLKVVVFGAMPANGEGVFLNLKFSVVGVAGTKSPMVIEHFRLNDGLDAVVTINGSLAVRPSDVYVSD
jgi:hypothetical protein